MVNGDWPKKKKRGFKYFSPDVTNEVKPEQSSKSYFEAQFIQWTSLARNSWRNRFFFSFDSGSLQFDGAATNPLEADQRTSQTRSTVLALYPTTQQSGYQMTSAETQSNVIHSPTHTTKSEISAREGAGVPPPPLHPNATMLQRSVNSLRLEGNKWKLDCSFHLLIYL